MRAIATKNRLCVGYLKIMSVAFHLDHKGEILSYSRDNVVDTSKQRMKQCNEQINWQQRVPFKERPFTWNGVKRFFNSLRCKKLYIPNIKIIHESSNCVPSRTIKNATELNRISREWQKLDRLYGLLAEACIGKLLSPEIDNDIELAQHLLHILHESHRQPTERLLYLIESNYDRLVDLVQEASLDVSSDPRQILYTISENGGCDAVIAHLFYNVFWTFVDVQEDNSFVMDWYSLIEGDVAEFVKTFTTRKKLLPKILQPYLPSSQLWFEREKNHLSSGGYTLADIHQARDIIKSAFVIAYFKARMKGELPGKPSASVRFSCISDICNKNKSLGDVKSLKNYTFLLTNSRDIRFSFKRRRCLPNPMSVEEIFQMLRVDFSDDIRRMNYSDVIWLEILQKCMTK